MTPVPPSDILTLSTRHSASGQRNHLPATMFRGPTVAVYTLGYCDRMSANRKVVSSESESEFESVVGYSRAVRVGPHVAVAGTTGTAPAGDIAAQTRDALRRIEIALQQTGAALIDVVRTRIYVTDIARWREVAAVHAEVFGDVRPAATMVEVAALITPDLLVEIEADAYVDSSAES
jgi:enamine deaminase RidA (YjgF/YER057c/UK114 family)